MAWQGKATEKVVMMDRLNFNSHVLGAKAADRLKAHTVTQTLRGASSSIIKAFQVGGLGEPFEVTLGGVVIGQAGRFAMDHPVYWRNLNIDDARRGGFDNRFELASALKRAGYRFTEIEEYSFYRIQFVWLESSSKSPLIDQVQFCQEQAEFFAEHEIQWHELALIFRRVKEILLEGGER